MEKVRLDCIRRLLEITERERSHELLLSTKNLQELGANPFPYIISVIHHPLLEELIKGEHFILVHLLKSIPGSSSQTGFTQGALVSFVRPDQSPSAIQDPKPAPRQRRRRRERKLTGPDPDTPPGFPGWSRLVEFHCTIPREYTKGPHLKEK